MTKIGLYLHIPFCVKKCGYCDFSSYAGREDQWRPVVEAMKAEMARAEGLAAGTVYFGGGTPTALPAEMLLELLGAVHRHFAVADGAEVTVEANPGTVDGRKLDVLRGRGVNRLSLGGQAAQRGILEALGRVHRWEDVQAAVKAARAAGFDNINLDLMVGLPGQRPVDFRETLDAALSLSPRHLSIYSLIVEPGTPFYARYGGHPELLPDEEELAEMCDDALWMTEDAGLPRYEISNYAKPGYESQHNLGYWLRRDYVGIGCAAHSLLRDFRWGNADTIEGYLKGERDEEAAVSDAEARFERLMLGLRLVEGISWGERALYEPYTEKFKKLRERGLMEWDDERVWLTKRGLDLQNRVMVELMG
ncbi:MAG: radical SAM family heme chaperone HemW [Firmicutes bacterium]|nr:radical SAM family heme chaperone HemW [Bacillota bacterium]